ncbi:MAG TPA: sugar ABC transporter permease [Thermoanaerobaculia bacterium]|nr:sugar ABC transporter permease [Thermoanaerobaculia bacterium]
MTDGNAQTPFPENPPPLTRRTVASAGGSMRAYTMVLALLAIWIFFQWKTVSDIYPYGLFLHPLNMANLLKQMAVTGVLAVGMLLVIVARQIDLSVGSMLGLAGGIAAMTQGFGVAVSLGVAILVGVAAGAIQGTLVAYAGIPAFIVTLGGLLTWRGVILYFSRGETVPIRLPFFRSLGVELLPASIGIALAAAAIVALIFFTLRRNRARRRHALPVPGPLATTLRILVPSIVILLFIRHMNAQGGVPIPVIVLLAVAALGAFLTRQTTFGRYLYAIGSNPDAARLSGINARAHILGSFTILGCLVGVAAILHTARVGSASPDAGGLMELDAIAACVIGGTSLMGGRGKVSGALLGALVMATLDNGMSLLSVENATQYIIKGAVLVAAVGFDMAGRRGRG